MDSSQTLQRDELHSKLVNSDRKFEIINNRLSSYSQSGEEQIKWAFEEGRYVEKTISFNRAYAVPPFISINIQQQKSTRFGIEYELVDVTAENFVVSFYNTLTSDPNFKISWSARGNL